MQTVTDITAITSEDVWRDGFGDQRLVITYGFAESLPDHQNDVRDQAFRNSFSELGAAAQATARSAFDMWEAASALNFIEVAADEADMVFGLFDFDASAQTQFIDGFAFFPGLSKIAGDVFINQSASTALGLYLHEIGHALGLEHPFEGDFILPPELDTRDVTVMSSSGPNADALRDFDIQAIQSMYGPPGETPGDVIPATGYSNAFVSSTSFSSAINALTYGETGDVTIQLSNSRFAEDPFGAGLDVVLVLSRDETVDVGDQVIGSASFADLAPGEQSQATALSYAILDDIEAGDYFVLLVVDPENAVAEASELDNVSTLTETTVGGVIGENPGVSPPPFLVDPRTGERAPTDPRDPPEEPDPADPPVEPPVDPPVEPPVDPPAEPPVNPPTEAETPGQPTEGADVLSGTNSADQIDGGGGADRLTGGGGGDTLNGGAGGDTLIGNGGRDQLTGGGGRDLLIGNGGKDTLEGGGGADDLQGGGGKDLLIAGGGRDTLDAGGGKDTMEGGNGRDIIYGGRGADTLEGGGGADRFIFDRGAGRDTITDFQQGRDKILIEGGASDFDALGIVQLGDDVMIRFANTRVLVLDDDVDNFTAADFIF